MGDRVQKALEALLPSLLQCQANGVFNEKEVSKIIKKRRHFEYCLTGKQCEKEDLLNYIHYEMTVEILRKMRLQKKGLKKKAERLTSSLSHIMRLFTRAVRLWPQDKKLWNQYIDFCFRSGSTKRVLGLFLEALAHHPRELTYWLLAVEREVQLGHFYAPRRLFLLALRQVPRSLLAWEEYLKFEIRCLLRLSKHSGSQLSESPTDLHYLVVLFKQAAVQLVPRDFCCFLVSALDYMSLFFNGPLENYFSNLDLVEDCLNGLIQEFKEKEQLMLLVWWKLSCLAQFQEHPEASFSLTDLFDALKSFHITCPFTCCALVFLCYTLTLPYASLGSGSTSLHTTGASLPAGHTLFTYSLDSEHSNELSVDFSMASYSLISLDVAYEKFSWFAQRRIILDYCLCVPEQEMMVDKSFWTDFCRRMFPDESVDEFLATRHRKEKKLFYQRIFESNTPHDAREKSVLHQLHHSLTLLVLKSSYSVCRDALQLLIGLYQHWRLWQVDQSTFCEAVGLKLCQAEASVTCPLDQLDILLVKQQIYLLSSSGTFSSLFQGFHPLNQYLKSMSNVPREYLIRIIDLLYWEAKRYMMCVNLIHTRETQEAYELKKLRSVHKKIKGYIDILFTVARVEDMEFLTQHLFTKLFLSLGQSKENTRLLIQLEWSRVVADPGYNLQLAPSSRQILKRMLSMLSITTSLEHLCSVLTQPEDHPRMIPWKEIHTSVLLTFQKLIDVSVIFDYEAEASRGFSTCPLSTLPNSLSLKHLILKYITLVFCLEKMQDLLVIKKDSSQHDAPISSEKILSTLKSTIPFMVTLQDELAVITTRFRNNIMNKNSLVALLCKEFNLVSSSSTHVLNVES